MYFVFVFALILSACTPKSSSTDVFTLKTPEGKNLATNHDPVKVGPFADGQLSITCNRSTEAKIRNDEPEAYIIWSKQYDFNSAGKSYKFFVTGDPSQMTKEVIIRVGTDKKLRTTFETKNGFEKSALDGRYGTILSDFSSSSDLTTKIEEVARKWKKVSSKYSCSLR